MKALTKETLASFWKKVLKEGVGTGGLLLNPKLLGDIATFFVCFTNKITVTKIKHP